jgi:hypothetical protein
MEPLRVYCLFFIKLDASLDLKRLEMVARFMLMLVVLRVELLKNKDAKNVVRIVEVICEH